MFQCTLIHSHVYVVFWAWLADFTSFLTLVLDIDYLEKGKTIILLFFVTLENDWLTNGSSPLRQHTTVHSCAVEVLKLLELECRLVRHLLSSPDLDSLDNYPFPYIEKKLTKKGYYSNEL